MPPAADRIGQALALLGDQWVLLIVQQAFLGVRRFSDWRRTLGVSEAVLAARLRVLVDAGVLVRQPYRDQWRTREEYRLTDTGRQLWGVLVAIWMWEYRWVPGRRDDLPVLSHLTCGQACVPILVCRGCGEPTTARDTIADRVPGRIVADVATPRRFRRSGWDRVADRPELFFPETLTILGDRWSTAITAALFLGVHRFRDLQRELAIGPSVLSSRLRELVSRDVVARRTTANPRAVDYRLTEKGAAFFPVIALLVAWADEAFGDDERSLTIRHAACGAEFAPTLHCDGCGRELEPAALRPVPVARGATSR